MNKKETLEFLKEKEIFDKQIQEQKQMFRDRFSSEIDELEEKIAESCYLAWEDEIESFCLSNEGVHVETDFGEIFFLEIKENGDLQLK